MGCAGGSPQTARAYHHEPNTNKTNGKENPTRIQKTKKNVFIFKNVAGIEPAI
jgi:hypothetical protein